MPAAKSSSQIIGWLTKELGFIQTRESPHGSLYKRKCPWCGIDLRVTVPRDRNRLPDGTLAAIYRQAHVSPGGRPKCPKS